jgi:serine/threonine-protein phosphatase 5
VSLPHRSISSAFGLLSRLLIPLLTRVLTSNTLAPPQYTKAIDKDSSVAAYYTNRSAAYLQTESFGSALADATKAIELDPGFIKAYYRRASANFQLNKPEKALTDFAAVHKAKPNSKDAAKKHKECEKLVTMMRFAKAISVGSGKEEASLSDKLKDAVKRAGAVEPKYDGPHLGDTVTVEFCMELVEAFRQQKKLHRKYALQILQKLAEYLPTLPTLTDVPIAPGGQLTVCGDTHGQFYDLRNIFELNGYPSESNPYLFNGDFVDRGSFSAEVVFTLFAFKLAFPNHFHLSRGNHETINMNKMYGFEGEIKHKYNAEMADFFTGVYNWLPLAHVVHKKVFVVHGGLFSRDGVTLDEIKKVDRNMQPPESGLMCEMLWSDPQPQMGRSPSKRGTGTQFGPDVTANFLETNGLELLIRSHEVKENGYEVMHGGKCITIFSAPNYCDQIGNKGAFITLKEDCVPKFTEFDAVPHPSIKPMAYAAGFGSMFGF